MASHQRVRLVQVRLDRRNAPWAFARGEAFRTIASLELLGALVSVMVLMPTPAQVPASTGLATLTCVAQIVKGIRFSLTS